MKELFGVTTTALPEHVMCGIEGVHLEQITFDPADYRCREDREKVELMIAPHFFINEVMQYYPNVKWLQLVNAGFEQVDVEMLKRRNIMFTNARSVFCATIAEDVIAKILLLARNYPRHMENQKMRFWPTDEQMPDTNLDLQGRVLGILGAGAIGYEIAIRAQVFGLHVRAYDPYVKSREGFETIYNGPEGMKQLLNESDFVITSLPVTPETRDIMNAETFAMMKPGAFFINVARGAIVDEDALMNALKSGQIRGAALDVTKEEPLSPDSPLWTTENLLITPHRAAYGDQMDRKLFEMIERNIHHYIREEPMENRIF